MDSKKHLNSASGDKHTPEKAKIATKSNSLEDKMIKECRMRDGFLAKEKLHRPSKIPVMKGEKTETKCFLHKHRHASFSRLPCCAKADKRCDDFEHKMKLLEKKEKSIADYYLKIENMIKKFISQRDQRDDEKLVKCKTAHNSCARKMTSEPLVFSKNRLKTDMLLDFESNVQQISDIWLKTSADLSNALKNLKRKVSFDSMEFEIENVRIQLAIKQAKSLTLVKTRNVIAEAKKLFYNREIIRTELENLLINDNIRQKCGRCKSLEQHFQDEKQTATSFEDFGKQNATGNEDATKQPNVSFRKKGKEAFGSETCGKDAGKTENKPVAEFSSLEEKEKISDEASKQPPGSQNTTQLIKEIEIWAKELAKKNETITNLNNKVFELQKTCNEHTHKYNLLQVKLHEFHEKFQWNHVLWKQIGKLKEQIKSLQQNNKLLETQKKELECKIIKLNQEMDRLIKLNHLLNQRKYLLNVQTTECKGGECRHGVETCQQTHDECHKEFKDCTGVDAKIFAGKQNAINQLKTILNVMKNQEDFAQKQISMFQSQIEELEKNAKA